MNQPSTPAVWTPPAITMRRMRVAFHPINDSQTLPMFERYDLRRDHPGPASNQDQYKRTS